MICIGIDPGASGGIAIVSAGRCQAWKMPETLADIWRLFVELACYKEPFALIERVHAMPKQGVSSTFKFGKSAGALEMALTAAGIPWEGVAPGVWQRGMGCLSRGDKNVTKARAQQLFPDLKITHATADALLIAEWCRRSRNA